MAMDYSTETATQLMPMGPGPAVAPVHKGINIKRMLHMRGPVMLAIALVLAVPLVIAVWFTVPRQYEASAAIRFAHTKPTPFSSNRETAVASDYGQYVETNVNLIKSAAVLGKVVALDEIRKLPLIADRKDPVYYLADKIDVRVLPNSELVQVSFKSDDRETAKSIVSATVAEFIKHASQSELETTQATTRQLESERDTLEAKLQEERQTVADRRKNVGGIISESGGIGVDSERQSYYDNLSKAMAEKTTSESQTQQLQAQLDRIQALIEGYKAKPNAPVYEFGVENIVSSDPTVSVQTQQLAQIDIKLKEDAGNYQENSPYLKTKTESRASVAASVEEAKRKAREKALLSIEGQTRQDFEKAKKSVEDATARVSEFDKELSSHASDTVEYAKAMSELKEAENELESTNIMLRDVREKIRVARADSRAPASYEIAVPTQVPSSPDSKRKLKFMALVAVMACGLAFAYGLYRELTDQHVRTPMDVKFATDLPVMALIPDASVERLPSNTKAALLTAEHPGSISADEFRRVLTRIIYPPEGSAELNTVLVTSASRGDGKTSLACNLAISLAQANRRVLLLDICARRPSVEKTMGFERAEGLGEVFANKISVDQAVRHTSIPNLHILGPGFLGNEVIGKLASRDTVEFLEKAEQAYEHVIIDTPPVLLMADAKLLAPVVDGVIMVVGAEVSSLGMVRRALTDLQQIGSNVIGVVLNRAKQVPGGYMRDNMERFYNYGTDDAAVTAELPDARGLVPHPENDELPSMLLVDESAIRPKQDN